jgi:hypothetical protein
MTVPDAILAMVRAAVPGVTVYDGRVPDGPQEETPPDRYVAAYIDPGTLDDGGIENRKVAHQSTGLTVRWQVTSVAPDRQMAAWLAERVRDGLVDQRPTVAGWACGLIEHTLSRLPRPDEQVQERPVVVAVDQYQLLAERLPTI